MSEQSLSNFERFKAWVENQGDTDTLAAMLHDDIVFRSPILEEAKHGRADAMQFILAARMGLGNEHFKYTRFFDCGDRAVLEFETKLGDCDVNGAQFIEWDASGLITDFKVMLRPLRALEILFAHMKATFEKQRQEAGE